MVLSKRAARDDSDRYGPLRIRTCPVRPLVESYYSLY
jgi:hypothetical protein